MNIHDIMTEHPKFINPDTTLAEASKEMNRIGSGFLPITDDKKEKLIGTITDRDIVIRGIAKGLDPKTAKVTEAMSGNVWYCYEDEPVERAAKSMEEKQVRRLVVLDRQKNLKGVISLGDISIRCHNDELTGEIIEKVCERE